MRRIAAISACLLVATLSTALASPAGCPPLEDAPDLYCHADENGWFYARTYGDAAELAIDARIAGERFRRYFGREPAFGAVVAAGTDNVLTARTAGALRARGARWHLPWLDPLDRRALQDQIILQRVRSAMPGASEEDITKAARSALARSAQGETRATDRSALRHEIGHKLLIAAFWPQHNAAPAEPHYGGPGPDWLDETAAILMESDEMADRRRQMLAVMLPSNRSKNTDDVPALMTLSDFFAAEHPAYAFVKEGSNAKGTSIRVLSGDAGRELSERASWLYTQARFFADFLVERSGNGKVFASIAERIAEGASMDTWIAEKGMDFHLPTSLSALEAAWQEWLTGRHAIVDAQPQGRERQPSDAERRSGN